MPLSSPHPPRMGEDSLPRRLADAAGEILEILGFAEILINRGESDVGDRVEGLQTLHHHPTDPGRRHFALAARLELALDRGGEPLDPFLRHGALAAGDRDRALEL